MLNLDNYEQATQGIGPLAGLWEHKPHALLYDLTREVQLLRETVKALLPTKPLTNEQYAEALKLVGRSC